jgi:hypothetical protein
MIYLKITHGWVAQHYDSETGDCVQQEFIPDDSEAVRRQDQEGNEIPQSQASEFESTEKEVPLDMVQP